MCCQYGMLIDGYFFCCKCIAGCGHVGVQGARGAPVLCWPFEAATPSSRSVHHWKGRVSWWCPQAWRDGSWRVWVFEELLSRQQLRKNLYTMLQNFMILHSLIHSLATKPMIPCSLLFDFSWRGLEPQWCAEVSLLLIQQFPLFLPLLCISMLLVVHASRKCNPLSWN